MTGFATELLDGAVLEIETAFSPKISIDLADAYSDTPPGPITQLLTPRYTLRRGNTVLLVKQPLGRPEDRRELIFGAILLVFLVTALLASK